MRLPWAEAEPAPFPPQTGLAQQSPAEPSRCALQDAVNAQPPAFHMQTPLGPSFVLAAPGPSPYGPLLCRALPLNGSP